MNTIVELTSILESSLDSTHQISSLKVATKQKHLFVCLLFKYFLVYDSSYALMSKEETIQTILPSVHNETNYPSHWFLHKRYLSAEKLTRGHLLYLR